MSKPPNRRSGNDRRMRQYWPIRPEYERRTDARRKIDSMRATPDEVARIARESLRQSSSHGR